MSDASFPDGRRYRPMARAMISLARTGLDLVLPRLCPGCARPGSWCAQCDATLTNRPRAVALPQTTYDRVAEWGFPAPAVHALSRYSGPVRAAIVAGKERGRRDLPPLLGRALGEGLVAMRKAAVLPSDPWLVPAPTRRAAARARGGDPVTAMARAAAATMARRHYRAGVAPCLFLARRTRDSVGLSAQGRAANLTGALRFDPRGAPPPGARVVVIDDVVTTGATIVGSYRALHDNGVIPIGALALAAAAPLRPALLGGGRPIGSGHGAAARS